MTELFSPVVPERASEALREALGRRLGVVAEVLLGDSARAAPGAHKASDATAALIARGSGVVADVLARRVRQNRCEDELWLLLVALTASFPHTDLVLRARRALGVASPEFALAAVLEAVYQSPERLESLGYDLTVESVSAVADVDFCARYDHNTGIQRVVRETMSRWNGVHDVRFACWSEGDDAFRELTPLERRRVVDWNAYRAEGPSARRSPSPDAPTGTPPARPTLVVPWHTTVILPEVAHAGLWAPLASLARFSGSRVAMIGYDTIPIGSADAIMPIESEKFAKYLTVVKNATRIAAISASAADEFRGFVGAVSAQGVTGPHVGCVTLAVESPGQRLPAPGAARDPAAGSAGADDAHPAPLVLIVGNQEPRKNLLAVLFAAETLWREGVSFRLRMIGGGRPDYTRIIDRECRRLRRAGFAVEVLRGAGDEVLARSYRDAYFTVFPSTHEGFGLPVAESLAMGVPSITSDFGSTQQIADGGGCLTVDPRDDQSIIRGMRRLLGDPAERERLAAEARARVPRSWDDYASDLWNELLEPLKETS
ncbi:glycosyltransferase [Subtercola boreus]|uniref:Glycosyl transferase family 1 domain-containing protein n=1 Tax=Subtercola boreus TaxID=120213 RepID=A0A3E0WF43_9MICO|nr:glycosyltransferase [Subtercola boreus]RFA22648.1 hypothetical protein B7R24_03275 [Subtercola boreus]RFA23004.1 hypothetical protein B7R23_03270 [Subtercola boreus]RFA28755.1 hypothetical protein B7R25_03285 [Subtercola boreus]